MIAGPFEGGAGSAGATADSCHETAVAMLRLRAKGAKKRSKAKAKASTKGAKP